jgi:hypothetical protein
MSLAQKKYQEGNPLLEVLFDESKAAQFPILLFSEDSTVIDLIKLFDEAEAAGVGGKRLLFFVALSLALYENAGVESAWVNTLHNFLKEESLEDLYKEFYANFVKQSHITFNEGAFKFKIATVEMRRVFSEGILKGRARWGEALRVQRDEDVSDLFGRLFAPGQCDIIRKMLSHEELTKTERETFSRVVKKKLIAIIDPELQRAARVLTGTGWKRRKKSQDPKSLELVRRESAEVKS